MEDDIGDDDEHLEGDDPDWDRYLVDAGKKGLPVGDPTRWGSQAFTRIDTSVPDQPSTQVLQASTLDSYSRSWALLGTLTLPPDLWNAAAFVEVTLEIIMGVGQAQVTHRIVLFSAAPAGGLCYTQYIVNGGPYKSVPVAAVGGNPTYTTDQSRAFAAIGALIGQSINIRAIYQIGAVTAQLPTTSVLNVILTPFAAGKGL